MYEKESYILKIHINPTILGYNKNKNATKKKKENLSYPYHSPKGSKLKYKKVKNTKILRGREN